MEAHRKQQLLDAANEYAGLGMPPFALKGKVANVKGWTSKLNVETWESMLPKKHACNIGIQTGPGAGIIVVDVDEKDGGLAR